MHENQSTEIPRSKHKKEALKSKQIEMGSPIHWQGQLLGQYFSRPLQCLEFYQIQQITVKLNVNAFMDFLYKC